MKQTLSAIPQTTGTWLEQLYGLCEAPGREATWGAPREVPLGKNEILRLDGDDKMSRLQVQDGMLWVTEAPAKGDVILRAGDSFECTQRSGVVAQAMDGATVLLVWR